MHTIASPRLRPNAISSKSARQVVHRQTGQRLEISQPKTQQVGVDTFDTDDSLVIESVPERQLYELPAAIVVFLNRAATRGFCPPIPVLRSIGFRTRREMEYQRLAHCWRW